jgi:hypothetical protein
MSNSHNLRLLIKMYSFFKKITLSWCLNSGENISMFILPWKLIYKSVLIVILQIIEQTMYNSQYLLF